MIHLVGLNPSLDLHFDLDASARGKPVRFPSVAQGKVGRVLREEILPGGKALNVARFLRKMRVPACTWIFGAGGTHPTHRLYRELLHRTDPGLRMHFSPSDKPIRLNLHLRKGRDFTKHNHDGPTPRTMELSHLRKDIQERSRPGDLIVLTGRLPGDAPSRLYRDWILLFQSKGRAVVLDTSGSPLGQALAARPFFLKVNRFEMQDALSIPLRDLGAVARIVPTLVRRGLARGCVTDGRRGSFSWEGFTDLRLSPGKAVASRDVVGAGDGFLAGWLAGFHRRLTFGERTLLASRCGRQVALHGIFGFSDPTRPRCHHRSGR